MLKLIRTLNVSIKHVYKNSIFKMQQIKPFESIKSIEVDKFLLADIYISIGIAQTIGLIYVDSIWKLHEYRQNILNYSEKYIIHSDFDAIQYGMLENIWYRLFSVITWPVSIGTDVIPYMILYKYKNKISINNDND